MPPQPKYHSLEQVQVLGKELLDYIDTRAAAGNHIYHMCEWYWDVKKMSALEWDSLRGRDSFVQHYENARKKVFLGMMRDKNLSTAYGSRFLAMYSSELRSFEREVSSQKVKDEIELKKADAVNLSEEAVAFNTSVMEKLDSLQKTAQDKKD